MIGYLKVKKTKVVIVRNPKVLKTVMFCDSNYDTNKEKINSVRILGATLGVTILTCQQKTQSTITLSSAEAEYVALLV